MPGGPVLVVDDDTVSRHVLIQVLANAELAHLAVGSGTEALEQIERVAPSIVLLDLVMPPPDGYEILRILRSRPETRDLPVVVLTALEGDEEIARVFEAGADDFVRKPFKPMELVARIRGQLRIRGFVEALAKREQDGRLVLELTQALASNLDFRSILFTVVQRIAEVARVDRVSIVLVRETGDVGYVVAASDNENLRDLPIDLSKSPEILQALESREPLIVPDVATHPLLEIVRHEGYKSVFSSLAILPILYEGRPMGVLFLRAKHAFTFGEREIALCKTISSAMAIALRNARVMQTLKDQTQEVSVARFEAERRLRTLQRYADFFESAADGIVVIDAAGHLLFSNPRARAITGYSDADLSGRRMGDLFPIEDVTKAHELLVGFTRSHFPQNVDVRIKKKNGDLAILSVNFNSVLREESVVLCTFRDVTAERAVEQELRKTKAFLQRVIDASVDAIVSADMTGRILLVNPAAERTYGIPVADLIGKDVTSRYPPGVARDIMRLIRAGGGRVEGLHTELLDANDERVPVSLSAALLYEGETPIGSVWIFTDLREKVRMEQRLAQAQEQILAQERQSIVAELAGAAAHELNQPLTSVMGYSELLKRRLDRDSAVYSAAEVIFNEAERMAEIVRKIGRITRYETKSYVGRARILDLDRSAPSSSAPPHEEKAEDKPADAGLEPKSGDSPASVAAPVAGDRGEG
ncbi:MAG: PAS domain S-box protein [Polyangiaceae bacterium]